MEFNQLPEGYDEAKHGPQKRQTEFDSLEAKLAYDAENLITKAKESLQPPDQKASPTSREQILERVEVIVSVHRKDYNEALIGAVNAKLDNEEQQDRLQQAQSREDSRSQYEAFIDGLKLSDSDTAKLKEMMSEANYVDAVETAKEMKASKIPTYEQIVAELMTFSPERLKDICEIMEKPELVIESDQSFNANISAMDANKHYTAADGRPQNNTYVDSESRSPYRNLDNPGKVKVSIVDGVVHPKQLTGVSTRLDERRDHLTAKFAAKSMKHISPKGMAAILQKSLRKAKVANDNSLVVDNWEKWISDNEPGTVTFVDPSELTESTLVAYAFFFSFNRRALFFAAGPFDGRDTARGRASVQVLEI